MSKIQWLPDVEINVDYVRDSRGRRVTNEYAKTAAAEALETMKRGGRS